ncbi:MAG: DNA repair protein RecN [Porticoccaceae bacterium]|nr:MAG: DNA repair protein RecN [Porticoccaceae bacterium]
MLLSLTIRNYTLVDELHLEFAPGMTAITGETGAGKSLVVEALGMALGDRGDTGRIRAGRERMEVAAVFELSGNDLARAWLAEQALEAEETVVLRRTLGRDGRSQGFIQGRPATMQQLRQLGALLIDIHGQHEHQSLLQRDTHRRLLTEFAGAAELAAEVAEAARRHRALAEKLAALDAEEGEREKRREFLAWQVSELDALGLAPGEPEALEAEEATLAAGERFLEDGQRVLALLAGEEEADAHTLLSRAVQLLGALPESASSAFAEARELLESALIQVDEATRAVRRQVEGFELDPERLARIQERLGQIHALARKHRVPPAELPTLHAALRAELEELEAGGARRDALAAELAAAARRLKEGAARLSALRREAAPRFAAAVQGELDRLGMASARFEVALSPLPEPGPHGAEGVEFLVSTNPGQPPAPLARVASGGELSRISLAIQVVAARSSHIPTLIFDEVDVGVGGAVAEVIGRLLRDLGRRGQVICITHLPQVAGCAHHHLVATKESDGASTSSTLRALSAAERVEEIARMLGGATITDSTREHAGELLRLLAEG